jgi:predicted permease
MKKVRAWLVRFGGLFDKTRKDREFDEELESHLEFCVDDFIKSGMNPAEARRQAILKLGGIEATKEAYRDRRGLPWLENASRDFRGAARTLRKNPGFTMVAVATLALGIGANTAVFTVINNVLLRPLPWPDSERVVSLWEGNPAKKNSKTPVAPAQFVDLRRDAKSFQALAGWNTSAINLVADGGFPERYQGAAVTEDFFRVVGTLPRRGTVFSAEQFVPGKDGVVLISDAVWRERFSEAKDVVGRTVQINGRPRTIQGIMPPGFQAPAKAQFWVPRIFSEHDREDRDYKTLLVLGRLAEGVTVERAQAEIQTLFAGLRQQFPDFLTGWDIHLHPALEDVAAPLRPTLFTLLGAVITVLLLACLNVANLELARGISRQGELSVRAALGAGRSALLRQLFMESLVLAGLGGAAGLLLARGFISILLALAPPTLPRIDRVTLDAAAFAYTAGACALTGILFGLFPAWRFSRANPIDALRRAGQRATAFTGWTRHALAIVQVGAAMAVLISTGLLLRSFDRLQRQDLGFDPVNLMTVRLELSPARYGAGDKREVFAEEVLRELSETPGVETAAATTFLPFQGWPQFIMRLEDDADIKVSSAPATGYQGVSAGYFRTMNMPVVKGRGFTADDRENAKWVTIVNQSFARHFFGDRDPIGRRFEVGFADPPNWMEIVGVVADSKGLSLETQPGEQVFVPLRQQPAFLRDNPALSLVVRGRGGVPALSDGIRRAVWAVDKQQPLHLLQPMTQVVSEQTAQRRFTLVVLSAFAGTAVLLASLGLYGVMSGGVAARRRELGIRLALGSPRARLLWLVLRNGLKLTLAGILLGLLASFASTRFLQSLLFEIKPLDPMTFCAVPLLLMLVALLACWLPARRAGRVNPMEALRSE